MKKNISKNLKLLFELSENSRIKKKDIGKKIKISPQLISYNINKLKKENIIQKFTTVVDPAKFGLINLIEFLAFTTFEKKKREEIISYLKKSKNITKIEEISHGADLIIEYTVQNLSYFNKIHLNFLSKFNEYINVISIYPIIVKHILPKDYLLKKKHTEKSYILSGDRPLAKISSNEKKVLLNLIQRPESTILKISRLTDLNIKTTIKCIKELEKKFIIKNYSIILNYKKLNIKGCYILINFKYFGAKDLDKITSFSKTIPEITQINKLIGHYSFLLKIESLENYNPIIEKLRNQFKFYDYRLYDFTNTIKKSFIPTSILKD